MITKNNHSWEVLRASLEITRSATCVRLLTICLTVKLISRCRSSLIVNVALIELHDCVLFIRLSSRMLDFPSSSSSSVFIMCFPLELCSFPLVLRCPSYDEMCFSRGFGVPSFSRCSVSPLWFSMGLVLWSPTDVVRRHFLMNSAHRSYFCFFTLPSAFLQSSFFCVWYYFLLTLCPSCPPFFLRCVVSLVMGWSVGPFQLCFFRLV